MIIDYRKSLKKSNKEDNEYHSNIDYVNMSKQKFINKLNKYLVHEIDKKVREYILWLLHGTLFYFTSRCFMLSYCTLLYNICYFINQYKVLVCGTVTWDSFSSYIETLGKYDTSAYVLMFVHYLILNHIYF